MPATIVAQSSRSGIVASQLVWLPYGAKFMAISAVMNAADITTGGNVVGIAIIWTFDCVQVGHAASCTWKSGVYPQPGGGYGNVAPGLRMRIPAGVNGFAGQLIVPRSLDVGLSMDIQDSNGNSLPIAAPSGSGVTIEVPFYPSL
jgi:hypothetical protein